MTGGRAEDLFRWKAGCGSGPHSDRILRMRHLSPDLGPSWVRLLGHRVPWIPLMDNDGLSVPLISNKLHRPVALSRHGQMDGRGGEGRGNREIR